MHIVQFANFHLPTSGGIRVFLAETARRYVAAGHSVTQVLPGPTNRIERSTGGVSTIRVRGPVVPGLGGYRMVWDRRMLTALVEHLRPDVVELSDRTTMLCVADHARATGVPAVLIGHERLEAVTGHVMPVGGRATRAIVRHHSRRVARRVDAIVCASRFAAEEFETPERTVVVGIPLGVDLEMFTPEARCASTRPESSSDVIRLVSVVRLSPEKDPHLPIAIVDELVRRGRSVSLDILGSGSLEGELRTAARGLPIRFHGHVSDRAQVASALRSADVAIAPGPNETFGLAALEALACGTPVVVPDRGALAEMVRPGVGLAVAPEPSAMADAVEWLIANVDRRDCRTMAAEYPWSRTVSALLDLFESLRMGRVAVA
jgi:alpha-1,6-mannosyltransferase